MRSFADNPGRNWTALRIAGDAQNGTYSVRAPSLSTPLALVW
jgi:hypothetical protein